MLMNAILALVLNAGVSGGPSSPYDATAIHKTVGNASQTVSGPLAVGTGAKFVIYPQEQTPAAPTATANPVGGGACTDGTHSFKITFVTAEGESLPSSASTIVTCAIGIAKDIDLTLIQKGSAHVTSRKIYMTDAGNAPPWRLIATIPNNTATTYTHSAADGVGASAPVANTTMNVLDGSGPTKICMNGTACTARLWGTAANRTEFAGEVVFDNPVYLATTTNVQGDLTNNTSSYGGSLAVSDPLRNLSTTEFLLESSTTATAGVDTGFRLNTLSAFAGADKLLNIANAGVEKVYINGDGAIISASHIMAGTYIEAGNGYFTTPSSTAHIRGRDSNAGGAIGTILDNFTALTVAGAKLVSVQNATVEKAYIDKDGLISGMVVAGELYDYESPTGLVLTNAGDYYQIVDTAVGTCSGMTCSAASDDITAVYGGTYLVSASLSGTLDAAAQTLEMKIYSEGVGKDNCSNSSRWITGSDEQTLCITCLIVMAVGDSLTIRIANTTSGAKTFSPSHLTVEATKLN